MRVLNPKDNRNTYSKFSLPGFRSGSLTKKIIACFYYLWILFFSIYSVWLTLDADFANSGDVILTIILEFFIVLILLTPVVAVGFSDYYDWHGIKLFLIIMISWCVLFTAANYISTLFSDEYIKSTNPISTSEEISSDSSQKSDGTELTVDEDIIKNNIEEIEK